jgi:hypothetical protein
MEKVTLRLKRFSKRKKTKKTAGECVFSRFSLPFLYSRLIFRSNSQLEGFSIKAIGNEGNLLHSRKISGGSSAESEESSSGGEQSSDESA